MEQRKQQQQSHNNPAPGPEGQLKFHPDTGAGPLGPGAREGAGAQISGSEGGGAMMSSPTMFSLPFQMMHPSQLQPVTRRMWMLQKRRSQNRPLSLPSWIHSTCDRSRTPTLWVPPKADGRGVECHNQTPLGTRPHLWPPGGGVTGWLFPPHTAAWVLYLPPQPLQPSNLWSPLSVPLQGTCLLVSS